MLITEFDKNGDVMMYLVCNVVIYIQASYSSYGHLWSSLQRAINVPNSVYLLGINNKKNYNASLMNYLYKNLY